MVSLPPPLPLQTNLPLTSPAKYKSLYFTQERFMSKMQLIHILYCTLPILTENRLEWWCGHAQSKHLLSMYLDFVAFWLGYKSCKHSLSHKWQWMVWLLGRWSLPVCYERYYLRNISFSTWEVKSGPSWQPRESAFVSWRTVLLNTRGWMTYPNTLCYSRHTSVGWLNGNAVNTPGQTEWSHWTEAGWPQEGPLPYPEPCSG